MKDNLAIKKLGKLHLILHLGGSLTKQIKQSSTIIKKTFQLTGNWLNSQNQKYDLVYLDPPYFFENQSDANYLMLYHFLDGIAQYKKWGELIWLHLANSLLEDI